jgi:hypothetical protein
MTKKGKRWGAKFVDKRNWPAYNRQLIKRGEYLLELKWVKSWPKELKEMNTGKVGRPYEFPESLIKLQAVWHVKQISFRSIEGVTRQLFSLSALPAFNTYTNTCRRTNELETALQIPEGDTLRLFCDGGSFQVVEGGEYLREKYGKKNRKWVQIVFWGDPKSKEPVSFEVNIVQDSELESGKRQLQKLVDGGIDVEAAGGDGAFDEVDFWNWLDSNGIEPVIKPDRNARDDSDSPVRNRNVKERKKKGHKRWSKKHGYGFRWPATEGILSAVKRIFGEHVSARSEKGMVQQVKIKFWAYQRMKRYGEA